MRVLITGVSGFVGSHMAREALARKAKVFGICRTRAAVRAPKVALIRADILDRAAIMNAVRRVRPDRVFHLAGQASVGLSWDKPAMTRRINVTGTKNLLEAILRFAPAARVHVAGSAESYGKSADRYSRIPEKAALMPRNPYARSKAAMEKLCDGRHYGKKLAIVVTRAFNHIGPGQSDRFVAASFAKQVALIESGRQKNEISVGNLGAVRDFVDVRDVTRAYWLALERGTPGEVYNVCSGKAREIRQILRYYLKASSARIRVVQTPQRRRKTDLRRLVGDPGRARAGLRWKPKISFEKTLKDILIDWKRKI